MPPSGAAFTATPLDPRLSFGVVIEDLDPGSLDEAQTRSALYNLWLREGLIIFRGLVGPQVHIKLSKVFGEPIAHPIKEAKAAAPAGYKELTSILYRPDDGWVVDVDGELLGQWHPWHSDLVYFEKINRGGILRPVTLPSHRGETGFIDQIAAYDRLSPSLQHRIKGLRVKYKLDLDPARQQFGKLNDARVVRYNSVGASIQNRVDEFPVVSHPMTYEQDVTGRTVLNVSPWFALGVEGMDDAAGDELLAEVMDVVSDERFAYIHKWQPEDMVLWDNWRMLHSARGCPVDEVRWLERTTILGDYGLGRIIQPAAASNVPRISV